MEIFNQQRKIKINIQKLSDFAEEATKLCVKNKATKLNVAIISDKEMRNLNQEFRGIDKTTDVLSFPYEPDEFEIDTDLLGDIAISAEQSQKQATENNLDLEVEIKQLILHGILHLCGYDHETDHGEMNEMELKLREKLGINY